MAKKKTSRSNHHETNAKAVASLMILFVGVALFVVFYNYQENLLDPSNFKLFMLLAIALGGLLVGLLYLLNPKK